MGYTIGHHRYSCEDEDGTTPDAAATTAVEEDDEELGDAVPEPAAAPEDLN